MDVGDVLLRGSAKALMGAWSAVGGAIGLVFFAVTDGWLSAPIGIAVGWYVALYIAYNNATTELRGLKDQAEQVRAAQPCIVFDRSKHAPLSLGGQNGEKVKVWQLWFRNRPRVQAVTATAQQMTAEVLFCDEGWQPVLAPFVGQWAVTKMPHPCWLDRSLVRDGFARHPYVGQAHADKRNRVDDRPLERAERARRTANGQRQGRLCPRWREHPPRTE